MSITKSLILHRVVQQLCKTNPCYSHKYFTPVVINIIRNMAQRSITSFFKVSPPKPAEDVENGDEQIKPEVSSKRPRLESTGSEAGSPRNTPLDGSEKKRKSKRQRIESSGSESMSPTGPAEQTIIKIEKIDEPKVYASPKTKKKNAAPLSEVKNSSPKQKNENGDTGKSSSKKGKKIKVKTETSVGKTKVGTEQNDVKNGKRENRSSSPEKGNIDGAAESPKKKVSSIKETKKESPIKEKVCEVDYNPAKSKYHPIDDACWSKGAEVPYLALAKTLEVIEATSARLKIVEILSNYFRSVIVLTPEDLLPSVYLCLNQLAPAYHSVELGIAETYLMKAIGQCTGRTLAQVRAAAAKSGDLGLVAEQARSAQRTMFAPPPLTARRVLAALRDIARMTGQASVNKKINKIQSLYVACKHSEARYLIRSLEGKLRIGLAEQSVLQALALATATTPPGTGTLDAAKGLPPDQFKARVDEHAHIIKSTYCECPNHERVIPVLLQHGVAALPQHCRLTPGVPLKPMLAHPTKGVSEVFDRFEKEQFTCEWKYDGERAQIHVPGDGAADLARAAVFSRNQEDNTSKYPDVIRRLPALLKDSVTSCVLDCEAVAYDPATKQILPFQILSTRKRKDAAEADIKVHVCVFLFDVLYLNGQPLVREPLARRRDLLREHFNQVEGEWQLATSRDCSSVEEVQQFLDEAVRGSCEGLMVKTLSGEHAQYDIARRSHNWLKLKKDYLEGVGDTVDAVVVGAYLGRGKRAGLFGGFLLACYEPHADEYQSLCKIGTGFSDEELADLTAALKEHVVDGPKSYYRFERAHAADVWFEAASVWEVRAADLSLSPAHRAAIGLVDPDKGISLRFPRFVRVRPDKAPEQATSAQQIADMYLAQDQVKNSAAARAPRDDFY